MADVDLPELRLEAEQKIGRQISDRELSSYTMYPVVFADYAAQRRAYGNVAHVPTRAFFYGLEPGDEIAIEIERGKTLIIRFLALGDADESGMRTVFFELNGQPRSVRIQDQGAGVALPPNRTANASNPAELGAPMPGTVVSVVAEMGQKVLRGDTLLAIEAMKMEPAVTAERDGTIAEIIAEVGMQVSAKDLLVVFAD
jgi:pyruvate carboxylase